MISLGGMAVLVALTKFKVVGHDFGLYFTIVATIFTGIGCGGEFLQFVFGLWHRNQVTDSCFYMYVGMSI